MSDCKITVREINFKINDEITEVSVYFVSDEPDNPFWGSGTKKKNFPPSMDIETILLKEIAPLKFLYW